MGKLAKMGQYMIIFKAPAGILGVHLGHKLDQGYQILVKGH